ncbi:MAG: hypothetical protein GY953_19025 [bacterium]|nr:hypothetical protein [bacterium]
MGTTHNQHRDPEWVLLLGLAVLVFFGAFGDPDGGSDWSSHVVNGRPQEPFVVQGFPPFSNIGNETTAEAVIRTTLQRYGRDRQAVEKMLNRFLLN